MNHRTTCALAVIVLALVAIPVSAHHAVQAVFDYSKPVKVTGAVTKVEFINPHSWIHLDVTGPDGKVVNWGVEGGSPNALLRLGFTKNSLPVGTEIVVDGYQAKDSSSRAVGKDLTLADGRRLFLGGSAPGASGEGDEKK